MHVLINQFVAVIFSKVMRSSWCDSVVHTIRWINGYCKLLLVPNTVKWDLKVHDKGQTRRIRPVPLRQDYCVFRNTEVSFNLVDKAVTISPEKWAWRPLLHCCNTMMSSYFILPFFPHEDSIGDSSSSVVFHLHWLVSFSRKSKWFWDWIVWERSSS